MIVVMSDLHFVDGTAGDHNLPVEAFQDVFLTNLIELVKDKKATEVKLVLLGDIPDLIRSAHWLDAPLDDRPWGKNGLADVGNWHAFRRQQELTATEQLCLRILGRMPESGRKEDVAHQDTILYQNWETFQFFRDFKNRLRRRLPNEQRSIPIQLIYLPGNHDRLCNLYPSVRDELRRILDLTITPQTVNVSASGEWWYPYEFQDDNYGVYMRHGHQYDLWNFGGGNDLTRRVGHLQVPIGDVLATEFAVRLPWEAAKHENELGRELVHKLQDLDNVRPFSRLLEWFYFQLEQEVAHGDIRQLLDEIFDNVVKNLVRIEFVQQWRTPLSDWDEALRTIRWLPDGLGDRVETLELPGWDEVVRAASSRWLRWSLDKVVDHTDVSSLLGFLMPLLSSTSDSEADIYMQAAFREHIWRTNRATRFILYGHTHAPFIFPLDGDNGREVFYINTGTWRERIQRTVGLDKMGEFVNLKQMTYVMFYGPGEDGGHDNGNRRPGTVSFDIWTGHKMKQYR